MRLPNTLAILVFLSVGVWAGEVDTSMTQVATLPGPARQLVEDAEGRIFLVLDGPRAGLALIQENGVRMVYEGAVTSAAASLDGFLFLVAGEEDRCVLRLSEEEATTVADGLGVSSIDVTAAFGAAPTGKGSIARSADGAVRVEGCPNLRRADGTFGPVPSAGGGDLVVPLTRDLFGNSWSLTSSAEPNTRVSVLAANEPARWQDVTPSEGGSWEIILADAVGFVWIAGANGLRRIDPSTDEGWLELPRTLSLPPGEVSALARSPNGRALVCFASGEVIEIDYNNDIGKAEIVHLTRELLEAPVQAAYTDSRGNVWLSMGSELYRRQADENAWQRHWKALSPMPGGTTSSPSRSVAVSTRREG